MSWRGSRGQSPLAFLKVNSGSAAAAWARGLAPGGLPWLERAARLAPRDPRVALDLARELARAGRLEEAARHFAGIVARYDELPAWVGLVSARLGLRDFTGAAAALAEVLARHCVPDVKAFHDLAALVARAAGFGGWRGMDARGRAVGTKRGDNLLGAPDAAALARVEGVVDWGADGLAGWACRPALQTAPPKLFLTDAAGVRRRVRLGEVLPSDDEAPFLQRYIFTIPAARLRGLVPPLALSGPDGQDIFGSPVAPLEVAPVPARGVAPLMAPAPAGLAVVVPVYRDFAVTRACLESVLVALPAGARVVVVDDATPEPDLAAWLDGLARRIMLIRHERNQGFVAAANAGLAAAGGADVLLLNSDTLVPPGAIEVLRDVAYAAADTASVTPFSNEATILSYPRAAGGNPVPDLAETAALQKLAYAANGGRAVEIPTGIGFCMYIRHDALAATGTLRQDVFAQGYGEENDWCLRASALGYAHRAATGAYVAHVSGLSFGSAGRALARRNLARLNQLHPGYDARIGDFVRADPLAAARHRLDVKRLLAARPPGGAVLFISHNHGGGVARQVAVRMAAARQAGLAAWQLLPAFPAAPLETPYPWPATMTGDGADDFPNLRFTLPGDGSALRRLLKQMRVQRVEMHHMLGHHPEMRSLAAALGVPQDVIIHDYSTFCPRVSLLTRPDADSPWRYCGEPDVAGCEACIARAGDGELYEAVSVRTTLARSAAMLSAASRVIVPSPDAARRMARHFPGLRCEIEPWEDDSAPLTLRPPRAGRRRIITIGGIGPAKGYDILRDCARDAAARDLPLEFIIAGSSAEDHELLETGRVFITGLEEEIYLPEMLKRLEGDLAFLPSIWPETWCFALSEAWRAGLYAVMFDLGAPAARLAATKRGVTLPLGLPVPRMNDFLCRWSPF